MRFLLLCFLLTAPLLTWAQHDSLVEVNGIVLSKDSLKPLPAVSVVLRGTTRGTITNEKGGFGMVALVGQEIDLTSVGYKPQHIIVSAGGAPSHVIILETDTAYIATAVVRMRPSKEQFRRDFVNAHFEDKAQETAKKSLDPNALKIISKGVPLSSSEKNDRTLTQNAKTYANTGTVPDMVGVNLLSLFGKKKRAKIPPPMGDMSTVGTLPRPARVDTASRRPAVARDTSARNGAAQPALTRDTPPQRPPAPHDTGARKPARDSTAIKDSVIKK